MALDGGFLCDDTCNAAYGKINKQKPEVRWVTFEIKGDNITVTEEAEREKTWAQFVESRKPDQPNFSVVDYEYTTADGRDVTAKLFVSWIPDRAKVKAKMSYASAKDGLKKQLGGAVGFTDLQANDASSLAEEEWKNKLKS